MIFLARLLIIVGLILLIIGGVIYAAAKLGLPLGRLPGDIRIERNNITCVFPLATSILLSIVLTLILNMVLRYFKK